MSLADLQERYRCASPRSRALFEQGRAYTAGAAKGAYYYPPYPLTMARGKGCYLWDVDGRRYVDCANHHTAQVLGHGHERVETAVREQMQKGIALGAPTGIESEIARAMCDRVDALERIRFVNSGTEATLHAIRLARGYTKRGKIAKFEGRLPRQPRRRGSQRGPTPGPSRPRRRTHRSVNSRRHVPVGRVRGHHPPLPRPRSRRAARRPRTPAN